jgi:hypothetical protein
MHPLRIATALVLVLALCAIQCKKDEDDPVTPSTIPAEMVGTWVFQGITVNGTPANPGDYFDLGEGTVGIEVDVRADGSFDWREYDDQGNITETAQGTVAVSGNTASMIVSVENGNPINPPEVRFVGVYNIAGTSMTLTAELQGNTLVLTLAKK